MASEKTEVLPAAETAETAAERFLTGEGEGAGDSTTAAVKAASAARGRGPGSLSFFLIATVVLALIGSTYAEGEDVAVGFDSYKSENKMTSEKTEVLPAAETAETAAERFLTGEGEGAGDTTAAPVKAASAAHDKS